MEFDADPRALTLSQGFIDGVNLLESFGWTFDINPNYTQMDIIREWVPKISAGVPMILDHCGKPGIAQGAIAQYREDVRDLARYPEPVDQALGPAALRRAELDAGGPAPLHRGDAGGLRAGADDLCRRLSDPAAVDDACPSGSRSSTRPSPTSG